ncbi:hypothetical protein M0813_10643 [Anaeramoeba flamelloides]|uniref:Uncharacterized protein n=1 Tax=Anaeramoeba flamelloides TaxID=1746091 RepID=A0ABQ8X3R0_9EUKA|nr:hypothetical protein M0813_10643 [Anaeramoeba flamelloides]
MNFAKKQLNQFQSLKYLKNFLVDEKNHHKQYQSLLKIKNTAISDLKGWKNDEKGVVSESLNTFYEGNIKISEAEKELVQAYEQFIDSLRKIIEKYKEWEVIQKKYTKAAKNEQNALNKKNKADNALKKNRNKNKELKLEMEQTNAKENWESLKFVAEKLKEDNDASWKEFENFKLEILKNSLIQLTQAQLKYHSLSVEQFQDQLKEYKKMPDKLKGSEKNSDQKKKKKKKKVQTSSSEDEKPIIITKEMENLKNVEESEDSEESEEEEEESEKTDEEKNQNKKVKQDEKENDNKSEKESSSSESSDQEKNDLPSVDLTETVNLED